MGKLVYLKVIVLIAALAAVVYVITHMSPARVAAGMNSVGLEAGGAPTAETSVNLCPTRVHAIVWPDGRKIQELPGGMKAKWQAYNLDPVDIGSMDMEKWLSLHCAVQATVTPVPTGAAFAPYAVFNYIDGTKQTLTRTPDGLFRIEEKQLAFKSPDLDRAFADLISLANLTPTGP